MNGNDPGKFLTSSVTSGAGTMAKGMGIGALGGAFEGAWLGASIGSIIAPGIGTVAGGAAGAGLGASFGMLTSVSKNLTGVWEKLISITRSLVSTFAKFDPLISAQQARWKKLDMQMGKIWAKTLAPTLKHLTDVGIEIKERWTRLKVGVFKSWEGVTNKLISALAVLVRGALTLAEFLEKLKNLIMDLIKFVYAPLIAMLKLLGTGFENLLKWLGFFKSKEQGALAGGPSWQPGVVGRSTKAGAGALGGTPLLRGKFVPGGGMPAWAKGGRMEFERWKDLKSWLGGYLDKIVGLLSGEKIRKTILSLTDPELSKQYKEAIRKNKKYPPSKPITEEELEEYRQEHNLPKKGGAKEKPTSLFTPSALPGAAGMIQKTLGMATFTSVAPEPKIRLERKPEEITKTERGGEVDFQTPTQEIDQDEQESPTVTRLRKNADDLWKRYMYIKGWKNLPKDPVKRAEIKQAYKEWEGANQALKTKLDPTTSPQGRDPETQSRYEQSLRELKQSGTEQRKELEKYTGVRRGPRAARKELFETTEKELKGVEVEKEEVEEVTTPPERMEQRRMRDEPLHEPEGGVIMQVLDSNQLLDMLSFSWDEIRNVLRHQQAEYTLLKYRMQTEGTYL